MTPSQQAAGERVLRNAIDETYLKTFRDSALKWFMRWGVVKDRSGEIVRHPHLKLQSVQRKMYEHYDLCTEQRKPCRMIVLKWRKGGASTGAQALMYHHDRRWRNRSSAIMGDVTGTSDQVFEIYRRFAVGDLFDWGDGFGNLRAGDKERDLTDDITLPNGSTYKKVTAGSTNANRSGTIQGANSTETSYYPESIDRDPLTSFLGSWSENTESSLGIIDSTSNGPFGKFYEYFMGTNDWHKIFVAWFEDDENVLPFASSYEEEKFKSSLMKHEGEQMDRFRLRLDQLHWLHDKLVNKCGSSVEQLNKEYPPSMEDAFLQKSALRFNIQVLDKMKRAADSAQAQRGTISVQKEDERVKSSVFLPDPNGDVFIYEKPIYGCKYALVVDSCTGEDQQARGQGANPDWHSVGIQRALYLDPNNGDFLPPKLVAHHYSRLEVGTMCELAAGLAFMYGECIGIAEVNGCGLYPVKKLAELGVKMWERSRKPQSNAMIGETSSGWFTNEAVRKTIIDNLASLIQNWTPEKPTFECLSVHAIQQLMRFIRTSSGRDEHMPNEHDDDVLMLAIGLYLVNDVATLRKLPERKKIDINKLLAREGWRMDPITHSRP